MIVCHQRVNDTALLGRQQDGYVCAGGDLRTADSGCSLGPPPAQLLLLLLLLLLLREVSRVLTRPIADCDP